MADVLDFSEYDPTNLDGSFSCKAPGKCLFRIDTVVKKNGKKGDYYAVNFIIEAHEDESVVGEKYYQGFSLGGKSSKGTMKLGLAVGALTDEMIQEAIAAGDGGMTIDLTESYGELVFSEIVESEWNNKPSFKCWDFYSPDDERCLDWPRPGGEGKSDDTDAGDDEGVPVSDKKTEAPETTEEDDDDVPF